MKLLYAMCRRIHRIVMMPDDVMGVEGPQQIVSTMLLEPRRVAK